MPTSLWGIAAVLGVAEASISEEPGAEIPHAGIRAGRGRETAPSTATAAHAAISPQAEQAIGETEQ